MNTVSLPTQPPTARPLTRGGHWIAAARDRRNLHLRPLGRLLYRFLWVFGRITWFCTLKIEIVNPKAIDRAGGYLLATTHLSHLEPFILSFVYRRRVEWISRI